MSRSSGCQQPPFGEDLQNDEISPFWGRSLTDAFQSIVFRAPTKTCSRAPRHLFRNERSPTETGGFELNPGEHKSRRLREPLLGLIRRQFPGDGENLCSTVKKPYHDKRKAIRVFSLFRNFLGVLRLFARYPQTFCATHGESSRFQFFKIIQKVEIHITSHRRARCSLLATRSKLSLDTFEAVQMTEWYGFSVSFFVSLVQLKKAMWFENV
jgi:hypothetical protein